MIFLINPLLSEELELNLVELAVFVSEANNKNILVDENLSSLNLKLKISIIEEMNIHLKKYDQTLIYVSHNIDEALLLADKIIIFSEEGNVHTVMDICIDKEERYKSFDKLALYEKQIIDIIMK